MRAKSLKLLSQSGIYLFLLVAGIPFVFPFWWMITSSFKTSNEIFAFPPRLLPEHWYLGNFAEAFTFQPFARHYFNSVYIAVLVVIGTLFVSSLAGYAFARLKFPGAGFMFVLLLSALMMPVEVTIVPNYLMMEKIGWTDTHLPLIILPIMGANGVVATFMMRQFFLTIPVELEEAALLDGLGWFGIYWKIALPLVKPALAAVAVITFLYSWNSFLEPVVFLDSRNLYTLPLSLSAITDEYGLPYWNIQLAATTLSVVPVLLFYIIAQKQVVNSFALSGIKG